jgi:hypothetical protein
MDREERPRISYETTRRCIAKLRKVGLLKLGTRVKNKNTYHQVVFGAYENGVICVPERLEKAVFALQPHGVRVGTEIRPKRRKKYESKKIELSNSTSKHCLSLATYIPVCANDDEEPRPITPSNKINLVGNCPFKRKNKQPKLHSDSIPKQEVIMPGKGYAWELKEQNPEPPDCLGPGSMFLVEIPAPKPLPTHLSDDQITLAMIKLYRSCAESKVGKRCNIYRNVKNLRGLKNYADILETANELQSWNIPPAAWIGYHS